MGIEPTLSAWEAEVLPLNYTRKVPALIDSNGSISILVRDCGLNQCLNLMHDPYSKLSIFQDFWCSISALGAAKYGQSMLEMTLNKIKYISFQKVMQQLYKFG